MPRKTPQKKTDGKMQITYACEKTKGMGSVVVGGDGKKTSFKCEFCNMHLMPIPTEMRFISHMQTENTIKHQMRQLKELN